MNRKLLWHRASGLLLATLLLACGRVAERAASGPPWNVVLICLDTVRADHLGCYGHTRATTPALDALARRSLVFRDASATAGWTKPSVPSFLTGTYPCQHGVYEGSAHSEAGDVTDLLPADALTLAEVFHTAGYRTGAFVHNAQLRAGNGFEQGFDAYLEDSLDAREIRWRGLDWLDQSSEQSSFLYLHFLDAHWPYPMPAEWVTRFASLEATAKFRGPDSKALYSSINDGVHLSEPDRAALEALYDGALAFLDSELGRFFAGLELRGLAANTIVCVVADHGEEFGEHGKVGHGHGLWENLLRVPWILHVPGRPAAECTTPVSLIDLFPTLLSAAGLPASMRAEGLDRLTRPDERRPILAEHKAPDRYFQTLRAGSEKLQRKFTLPPQAPALRVKAGTRWEAEFEVRGTERVATQMKPRSEEVDDPPELKGRIESLTQDELTIAGLRVHFDASSARQTDKATEGPELALGQVVKVRGPLEGGVQRAERIKFYPPGEGDTPEIRGTVTEVEGVQGSGRIVLGGFVLTLTSATDIQDDALPSKGPLAREGIFELVTAGASGAAEGKGFAVERNTYDLGIDPRELAPAAAAPGSLLEVRLDQLGAALASKRIFAASDQKQLDPAAVKVLEAIGYGGGR